MSLSIHSFYKYSSLACENFWQSLLQDANSSLKVFIHCFLLKVYVCGRHKVNAHSYTNIFSVGRLFEKKSNKWYTVALACLWIAATMHMSFQWARVRDAFINHHLSPLETTLALGSRNDAIIILSSLCPIITNGILVGSVPPSRLIVFQRISLLIGLALLRSLEWS